RRRAGRPPPRDEARRRPGDDPQPRRDLLMAIGHEACSGCSLCLPACPVWRATRDIRFSPQGRVKALQHGATAMELEASVDSCTLCGSCEPACPENISLTTIVTGLRAELARV